MGSALLHWIIIALSLVVMSNILPGIHVSSLGIALIAALVIGLVNVLIKPLISLLTLPLNLLTLGLFSFVVNALMFGLAAYLVPGFEVANFFSALIGSLFLALVTTVMGNLGQREAYR